MTVTSPTSMQIITLLISHERHMGKLYTAYRDAFPAQQEFWESLIREEEFHAELIEETAEIIRNDNGIFAESRFRLLALEKATIYIDEEIDKAVKRKVTPIEAISVAYYLEKSLFEQNFYDIFSLNIGVVNALFTDMKGMVQEHIARVEEMREKMHRQK